MIDPKIWQDESFGSLTLHGKVTFIGLFSQADDEGRGNGSPAYLKAVLFPYDTRISTTMIVKSLEEISAKIKIQFYKDKEGSKVYYQIINWDRWQYIQRPTPSDLPKYDPQQHDIQFTDYSRSTHGEVSHNMNMNMNMNRKEYEKNMNTNKNTPAGEEPIDVVKLIEEFEKQKKEQKK
jgi:hypothetical protein